MLNIHLFMMSTKCDIYSDHTDIAVFKWVHTMLVLQYLIHIIPSRFKSTATKATLYAKDVKGQKKNSMIRLFIKSEIMVLPSN